MIALAELEPSLSQAEQNVTRYEHHRDRSLGLDISSCEYMERMIDGVRGKA